VPLGGDMSIDLSDSNQWNLVFRRELVAAVGGRIPVQTFSTTARQVFIGIYVPDEPTWYRAGFLTQYIPALASSTNDLFTALTQVANYKLTCRNYQVIELQSSLPATSVCTILVPAYFRACTVEVFARNDI
jgi:hypothetical protein